MKLVQVGIGSALRLVSARHSKGHKRPPASPTAVEGGKQNMLKRIISVALIALLLGASGCGLRGPCYPRTFCGSGCGELYISDWHNYPPDCQDPCDCHGDYTGEGSKYWGPPSGFPVQTTTYETDVPVEPIPLRAGDYGFGT